MFDEPLSNLDAKLHVQMRYEIKALQDKVRTTSVYVTHDQIEAMTLADRIVVMNKGRVEQVGTPLDLYRRPGNMFVAGFIGSPAMNFLSATVRIDPLGQAVELADGSRLRIATGALVIDGQPVARSAPRALVVSTAGGLTAAVSLVEPTGAQTHLHVAMAGQDTVIIVDGALSVVKGATIAVGISPDLVHVFDQETGARLNGDLG